MSDDGFEPLSPQQFWQIIERQRSGSTGGAGPPGGGAPPGGGEPLGGGSLEERLRAAQEQGLAPNLRRQLAFVGAGEPVFEFQALGFRRYPTDAFDRTRACHARGPEAAVSLCAEADNWIAHGVYLMPARLRSGVETRHVSPGRWYDLPKGGGTTDSDIAARLVLAVDFDVKRSSGISATEEEVQHSVRVAQNAWSYLAHHLGENSLAYLHSGNGRQIHVALDAVPVGDESKNACSALLTGLAHLFNTPEVSVDEKLYDPKRILPACGTMKKKGAPGVVDRPHRRTAIVTPEAPTRVSLDQIVDLVRVLWDGADADGRAAIEGAMAVRPRATTNVLAAPRNPGSPFDVANAVDPHSVAEWLGLYNARGEVVCPGCGETSGVAVLNRGLKCLHNRCKDRGRSGFRSNVDLVAEVHRVAPRDAVAEIGAQFGLELHFRGPDQPQQQGEAEVDPALADPAPTTPQATTAVAGAAVGGHLPPLADVLLEALKRAKRRADGVEKPIPLRWPALNDHFGGGLWSGVHVVCSSTGVGKTALGMQQTVFAAEKGVPSAYVGLELRLDEAGMRILGDHAKVPWSRLYTGRGTQRDLDACGRSAVDINDQNLPLHVIPRRAQGWPASKLASVAEAMRAQYPEEGGPGSRPIFLAVDFLQLIGPELVPCGRCAPCRNGNSNVCRDPQPESIDIRERVARASYTAHTVAEQYDVAVWLISSVARERYNMWKLLEQSSLSWDLDDFGRPVERRVQNPDALVGLGKESGEIEYSADSVSAIVRVPDSWSATGGCDVVFATAKGRATGASWSPLRFTGFGYVDSPDGGMCTANVLAPGGGSDDRKKRQEQRQEEEDRARTDRESRKASVKDEEQSRTMDAVVRVVGDHEGTEGVGTKQLRNLVSAATKHGKDKVDVAIAACVAAGLVLVDKKNTRDHRHSTPRASGGSVETGGSDLPKMRERADFQNPPHPLVGGKNPPHVGGEVEDERATPATPATPLKGNGKRVAGHSATPATPENTAESDAAELFEVDFERWRDHATGRGWSGSRYAAARGPARARLDRARADAVSLRHVQLRGEDPRASATEWGWDDERTRAAMRFVPPGAPPKGGGD